MLRAVSALHGSRQRLQWDGVTYDKHWNYRGVQIVLTMGIPVPLGAHVLSRVVLLRTSNVGLACLRFRCELFASFSLRVLHRTH